jgi:molecular chaperone GrpE (heat shock protein)
MQQKSEIKALQDQLDSLSKDSGSQVRDLQAKIKQMQEDHEKACAQMNEDFAAKTAEVRSDYEK